MGRDLNNSGVSEHWGTLLGVAIRGDTVLFGVYKGCPYFRKQQLKVKSPTRIWGSERHERVLRSAIVFMFRKGLVRV